MMEAASTSETSVNFYQTTRRYNPEDSHLHTRSRENLKSYNLESVLLLILSIILRTVTNKNNTEIGNKRILRCKILRTTMHLIICKSSFSDFVHRLYFNKITTFRKLDLLPSSGKKGRTETLAVGPPGWASLRPGHLPKRCNFIEI
jgi:hypothetical protein